MNSPSTKHLLKQIQQAYPRFTLTPGTDFAWQPQHQAIVYNLIALERQPAAWFDLFHELGHATLGHKEYEFDVLLIKMEAEAWQRGATIAQDYEHSIPFDYIQSAVDTYREWLYDRSTCPECTMTGVQKTSCIYQCLNCRCSWRVNEAKFCALRRYQLA